MIQAPGFLALTDLAHADASADFAASDPAIAALADGGFVLVWTSYEQDGDGLGVFGQRFDAAGDKVGAEFRVNTHTPDNQNDPSVAALETGGFVVTWTSQGQDGSNGGIFAQRFDADGAPQGGEFRVSSGALLNQRDPDVTATAGGGFFVAWSAAGESGRSVRAQAYDADGAAAGSRRVIAPETAAAPALESFADGEVLVAWGDRRQTSFTILDDPLGAQSGIFSTDIYGINHANAVDVVATGDDTFLAAWSSSDPGRFVITSSLAYQSLTLGGSATSTVATTKGGVRALAHDPDIGQTAAFKSFIVGDAWESTNHASTEILLAQGVADTRQTWGTGGGVTGTRLGGGTYVIAWAETGGEMPARIAWRLLEMNAIASGAAQIEGRAFAGETLTAVIEHFDDPDGIASVSHQWLRDGAPIEGATGLAYTLTDADTGHDLIFSATLIDGNGTEETLLADDGVLVGARIEGTDGADDLAGTAGADLIDGRGGNDTIAGLDGDDTLMGGDGDDQIDGGTGADSLAGDGGSDRIDGGDGADSLAGGDGNDVLSGERDGDLLDGGAGDDILNGGDGDDTLLGGAGRDEISGAAGEDLIDPGAGADTVYLDGDLVRAGAAALDGDRFVNFTHREAIVIAGETLRGTPEVVFDGTDTRFTLGLAGGDGREVTLILDGDRRGIGIEAFQIGADIGFGVRHFDSADWSGDANALPNLITGLPRTRRANGAAGDDTIHGGRGPDALRGDAGNDVLLGGGLGDRLWGGTGDDLLHGEGIGAEDENYGDDRLAGEEGNDTLIGGWGEDTLDGGPGDDLLYGQPQNDTLDGGDGDDTLDGGGGNDEIFGRDGNDSLLGGNGGDRLLGEVGDDFLSGDRGNDTLSGGDGDDTLLGGTTEDDLRDVIYGGHGDDSADGGYGNDELYGGGGNDTLAGGFGADTIMGQDGDDVITGSAYADIVFGGAGDDFINGGFGHDLLNGGDGADRFFHIGGTRDQMQGHGSDWVQDYDAAEGDVLVFGGATATAAQFQVNFDHTANRETGERSGDDDVQEAFVIYKPTGQIMWALVDGGGQAGINLMIDGEVFDLLA